jgi:hypothetical protein
MENEKTTIEETERKLRETVRSIISETFVTEIDEIEQCE